MKTYAMNILAVHSTGLNIVSCMEIGVCDAYLTDDMGNFVKVQDERLVAASMHGCDDVR